MTESLASVADLEKRSRVDVGTWAGAELTAAELAIEDASALVLAIGNPDWTLVTVPASVRRVVIGCALREVRNPERLQSESMGGGAYSWSAPVDETSAYLTDAEEAIVAAALAAENPEPAVKHFAGSVRTPSAYAKPSQAMPCNGWGWLW